MILRCQEPLISIVKPLKKAYEGTINVQSHEKEVVQLWVSSMSDFCIAIERAKRPAAPIRPVCARVSVVKCVLCMLLEPSLPLD
jgi:hypothetical protein